MKVIFRTDASRAIGTGHVMRCLALAETLRERGAHCHFISRAHPGNLNELIQERGFVVHSLTSDSNWIADDNSPNHAAWLGTDWVTDVTHTKVGFNNELVDWLVVDHYALDIRWETAMRSACPKIMVIDDIADRRHDCDLLLNQNLLENSEQLYEGKVPLYCGKLLGPSYALLQRDYAHLRSEIAPRQRSIRRVLVSLGGADPENVTSRVIEAFLRTPRKDVRLDVVIGSASPHARSIRKQVNGSAQICLHESPPTLAPLLSKADLSIGACGVTALERCCLGIPSLVVSLAENQRVIAAELDRRGLVRWLGDANDVDMSTIDRALTELLESDLPEGWSDRCRNQVDGKGAARVAAIMAFNALTPLSVRLASADDEEQFLRWANDREVRRHSFNSLPIPSAIHHVWFQNRIHMRETCRLFIVEAPEGFPVGQVRFENANEEWELHYAVDVRYRRRGVAAQLLTTVLEIFIEEFSGAKIFARVKPENVPSRRVFQKLGFFEIQGESEIIFEFKSRRN